MPEAGTRFELRLNDQVQDILLRGCERAGLSPGDFVARAVCFYAQEAVGDAGKPALCDELTAVPEFPRSDFPRSGDRRFRGGA